MLDLQKIRQQFPALARTVNDRPLIYLDGPAGTQVPQRVVDRVSHVMLHHNANRAGKFVTSREVDGVMEASHATVADFLGASEPSSIVFGPNMTTLTLQFSRAISRTWNRGDRIVVSRLDHDANFSPWVLAAQDAGVEVAFIDVHREDATLNLQSLEAALNERTRLVAVTAASNAVGSMTPVAEIARRVHAVGAELFVDAVHYAPHRAIDVSAWDCDYLVCSAYKFFGPHIGILYGRLHRLREIRPYKLRPAPESLPGRWMTGTQNFACVAGAAEAIEYIADLSSVKHADRRTRLLKSFEAIAEYESRLIQRLIDGLLKIDGVEVFGITDPARGLMRAPTVAFRLRGEKSIDTAQRLGEQGICSWHGNYYALPLTETLGVEPDGMVRLGCMHYNTVDEIDRTLEAIAR